VPSSHRPLAEKLEPRVLLSAAVAPVELPQTVAIHRKGVLYIRGTAGADKVWVSRMILANDPLPDGPPFDEPAPPPKPPAAPAIIVGPPLSGQENDVYSILVNDVGYYVDAKWIRSIHIYTLDGPDLISFGQMETGVYVEGGAGGDGIKGTLFNDTLIGGGGSDYIFASNGNDYVTGDNGNDTVVGGLGVDTVYGGRGNDLIGGGSIFPGDVSGDRVFGGAGNDVFDKDDSRRARKDFSTKDDTFGDVIRVDYPFY